MEPKLTHLAMHVRIGGYPLAPLFRSAEGHCAQVTLLPEGVLVTDLADRVNGGPCRRIDRFLDPVDLVNEPAFHDTPKIADHALKAAARWVAAAFGD